MTDEEKILDLAIDIFGVTDKCLVSSFILPDGNVLDIRSQYDGHHQEHDVIKEIYPQEDISEYEASEVFSKEASALILYQHKNRFGLDMNLKSKITSSQWDKLEECVCYHKPEKDKEITYIFYNEKLQIEKGDRFHAENTNECFEMIKKIKKHYKRLRSELIEEL